MAYLFTLAVIADFVALAVGQPPAWVFYLPLPPLFLMLFTGLYMLALPHVTRWRRMTASRQTA